MKYFIFIIILLISLVSADCDKNQIDINTASLEKLDEITWVGPATAQKIINARPYTTLKDITKVSGIGDIKLQDIKDQGIACVDGEVQETPAEKKEEEKEDVEPAVYKEKPIILNKNPEPISLNEKSEDKLIYISKNAKVVDNLSYAFSIFLIFIIGILIWERF